MTDENDKLPFDVDMCASQFYQTLAFVSQMQGDERTEHACAEAGRMCAELFEPLWTADDRTEYMTMLGYLAMDLAANVAYTIDRAAIREDVDE